MSAFRYTARCRDCEATRGLKRADVLTGKNPVCECGAAMVVYSGAGAHLPTPALRADPPPAGEG